MGNYVSCTLSSRSASSSSRAAKVILPTREVRTVKSETKAAELMMEFPSYFLVNSCSMRIGRRFSALTADEDLEIGNVYVMFPMRIVNSAVVSGDVAAKMKMRVVAAEEEVEIEDRVGSICNIEKVMGAVGEDFKYRLSMCRSRKPKLKTIKEEPIC